MATIDCICPPTADGQVRHPDGDTVTLKPTLSFHEAISIRNQIAALYADGDEVSAGEILATLTESYLLFGVESWTIADEKGKPVPVTKTAIRERLLSHLGAAVTVGEAADELYQEVVLPLLLPASTSSPPGRTDGSTSAPTALPPKRPKRSSPSSTTTTPTVAIGTMSSPPAGASS